MSFRGTYEHSVDGKGRVSLPAKFRKELPDEVVIVPVPDEDYGKALYVFSDEAYDEWYDSFFTNEEGESIFNRRSKNHISLSRYLDANTESVAVDSAGRIKLSAVQRKAVGIERDVAIIGQRDHVEIWDAQAYADYMARASASFADCLVD